MSESEKQHLITATTHPALKVGRMESRSKSLQRGLPSRLEIMDYLSPAKRSAVAQARHTMRTNPPTNPCDSTRYAPVKRSIVGCPSS